MIYTRKLAITISWALLSAPLIFPQQLKRPAAIQELALRPQSFLGTSPFWSELSPRANDARVLSSYREFRLGTTLLAVAKQADLKPSEARTIYQRPAVIQELEWRPQRSESVSRQDSVKSILFSFYNGDLFRMVVSYDQYRTEGLTDQDMVDAISSKYGAATTPRTEIRFSSSQVYNDSEVVIARWEDSRYSLNLFRSSYQPNFGMMAFSKGLDALARTAVAEGIRLDEQEAPGREMERQKRENAVEQAAQEKARVANKPNFRP